MIYPIEPYPDEMDQARDFLIRQDEESVAAQVGRASQGSGAAERPTPASAADPDELLAKFAELVLAVAAARSVS